MVRIDDVTLLAKRLCSFVHRLTVDVEAVEEVELSKAPTVIPKNLV